MKAKLTLSRDFQVCKIDNRIYSSFVEHMGRCVYNGIYEPTHETADENGFRNDVKELVRDLNLSVIRYPGGNFVSNYRWEDGVGPRESRPKTLNAAWTQLEPNEVGTDEFHAWAKELGVDVMMAANLGTRGMEEAGQLLEYCNLDTDTPYARMRAENGHPEPYRDRLWCLGNEMDGSWQVGACKPEDYADIAQKTAHYLKLLDPEVELAACGSANSSMPTFGIWEQAVLERAYNQIDYLSLHQYIRQHGDNETEYLGAAADMEQYIHTVISLCDAVGGKKHSKKKINLSFDEWNVWPRTRETDGTDRWGVGTVREEYYFSMLDALVFSTMLNTLLRNAERIKVACFAQLVNVCAPIMTVPGGSVWKQTIYYPFMYASKYGRGALLDMRLECPTYTAGRYGEVAYLDTVAVYNEERGEVTIFAVNRSEEEKVELPVSLAGFGEVSLIEHVVMEADDRHARNSAQQPDLVVPRTVCDRTTASAQRADICVHPLSWNMIRLKVSPEKQEA